VRQPVVLVSSWPPRKCGIGTFAEEAAEFIREALPENPLKVVCHTDGAGTDVYPVIDLADGAWHQRALAQIEELDPYVVHFQHEYGLYEYVDQLGQGDENRRFLRLLDELKQRHIPTVVEPHTVHGRLRESEESFLESLAELCDVLIFKCAYQKWRLGWMFTGRGAPLPTNIMIVPHGARPDRRYAADQIPQLKRELGLELFEGKRVAGLVGWIQNNKRWDIVTDMWEELHEEIEAVSGDDWYLLAAGDMRDPNHRPDFEKYVARIHLLAQKGLASFYQFVPRGDVYYKVMAICDFVILPSLDETQSGTLARIIALNKPYITTAPLEGLTSQTVESEGGLLFTDRTTLRRQMLRLATDEGLRWDLGYNLYHYLTEKVSWEVVAGQYAKAYELARASALDGVAVSIDPEF